MTDTDRLAALLHDCGIACDAHGPLRAASGMPHAVHRTHAARLIAAGVTLAPRPAPDAALDVERLARTLAVMSGAHPEASDVQRRDVGDYRLGLTDPHVLPTVRDFAAAIAREYAALADPEEDGAANFDAAVQRAFAGTGVEVRTSFTPRPAPVAALNPSAEPYYLPLDCPVCGRRRMEWNGKVLSCEKCNTSSEWDGFTEDHYPHTIEAPTPPVAPEHPTVDEIAAGIDVTYVRGNKGPVPYFLTPTPPDAPDVAAIIRDALYELRTLDGPTIWDVSQKIAAALVPTPPDAPDVRGALERVAEIMRRHTHQGTSVLSHHAGRNTEEDCDLCRALVDAGVLTLDGIGSGTRAAMEAGVTLDPTPPDALREAAQALVTATVILNRWDEANHYVVNSERDALAGDANAAWDALRAALEADR